MHTPESIAQKYENRKIQEQINKVEKLNKLERQKQVYVMDLQGYQNQEIADKLNISLSTVEKDLHEIREQSKEWFKQVSDSGLLKSLVDGVFQIDYAQKELWKLFREETKSNEKIKLLDSIINASLKKKEIFWASSQKPSSFQYGY